MVPLKRKTFPVVLNFDGAVGATSYVNQGAVGAFAPVGTAPMLTAGGKFGQALRLTSSGVIVSDGTIYLPGAFAIGMWVRRHGYTGRPFLLGEYAMDFGLTVDTYVNEVNVDWSNAEYGGSRIFSTTTTALGESTDDEAGPMRFLLVNRDAAGTIKVSVDGVLLDSLAAFTVPFSGRLTIGGQRYLGVSSADWQGALDGFFICDNDDLYPTFPFAPPTVPPVPIALSTFFPAKPAWAAHAFDNRAFNILGVVQTLDDVVQTATMVHKASTSHWAADQLLDGVIQTATGRALIRASAAQVLDGVVQTATGASRSKFSAAQVLDSVIQAAAMTHAVGHYSAAQLLDGVQQTALSTARITGAAAQTLDSVVQLAAAQHKASGFVGTQTLDDVQQTATGRALIHGQAAQTLDGVIQSATGGTREIRHYQAAQTLDSVEQVATATLRTHLAAAQTLDGVIQTATARARIRMEAAQQLDGVTQLAEMRKRPSTLEAHQVLDNALQEATARALIRLSAAQQLDDVEQLGRLQHDFIYLDTRRVLTIAGRDRTLMPAPRSRELPIPGRSRELAITGRDNTLIPE